MPTSNETQLSNAQMLIWSGQAMHSGTPLYNMNHLFRIAGAINPVIFERAFTRVVQASGILDSTIRVNDGVPSLQQGNATNYYSLVDLTQSGADSEAALANWVEARTMRSFDLEVSMVDCCLILLPNETSAWYYGAHHLLADGWATGLIFQLVSEQYQYELAGESSTTLVLPQYSELEQFEQKIASTSRFENAREYWESVENDAINLPLLYRRDTSRNTTSSTRCTVTLNVNQMTRLRALANHDRVVALTEALSFHSILLSILAVFVSRVSRSSEFALSMTAHNRLTPDFRKTIGTFVELFPMAVSLDMRSSFIDTLESIRGTSRQVFQHALPGLGKTELNRRSSVVLNYVNATFGDFAGIASTSQWVHCGHFDSNHVLRLHVHDFDSTGQLTLHFDFADDAFSEDQRDEAIGQYLRLFDALVQNPDLPIGKPALVEQRPPSSRESVLDVADVLAKFDSQAAEHANGVAIVDGTVSWNYQQLADRSKAIAKQLVGRGVAIHDRVGIYLDRKADFVASILACLRVGAAFVPLERSSAVERAAAIFEDAKLTSLISDQRDSFDLSVATETQIVWLDEIGNSVTNDVDTGDTNDCNAYVIYTSGSTGTPKGVVVSRHSLSAYADWAGKAFATTATNQSGITMPLFTSLSYDLAITSIFVPLTTGGTIRIYRSHDQLGDASLVRQVLSHDEHDVVKLTRHIYSSQPIRRFSYTVCSRWCWAARHSARKSRSSITTSSEVTSALLTNTDRPKRPLVA